MSQRKTFWHYLPIGVLVALIASTAWMITFALIYSQSAILNISDWELTKRKNRINLLGADESLLTRSVFARGEFQGNAWYGFQEILSREKFHPQQISFDFRLSTELSHLSLIFGSGEKGSIALRFSRHPEFPAGLFLVSPEGKFLFRKNLDFKVQANKWQRAELALHGGRLALRIDHSQPLSLQLPANQSGKVGFRGGFAHSAVRNVELKMEDGRLWKPDFRLTGPFGWIFSMHFLVLILLSAFCFGIFRLFKWNTRSGLFHLTFYLSLLLFFAGSWTAFDWFFWSDVRMSAFGATVPHDRKLNFKIRAEQFVEYVRYSFFDKWWHLLGLKRLEFSEIIRMGYPETFQSTLGGVVHCGANFEKECELLSPQKTVELLARPKNNPRILFVGTSQTFGCGARGLDESFFARSVRRLQREAPRRKAPDAINLSLIAGLPSEVLASFKQIFPSYRPDLVVINMVENFMEPQVRPVYEKLLTRIESEGVKAVILSEAVTFEAYKPPYESGLRFGTSGNLAAAQYQNRTKHLLIADLARSFHVPVLPLESYLHSKDVRDSGYLWWDHVHLSSAGHQMVADWLAPQLKKLLFPEF